MDKLCTRCNAPFQTTSETRRYCGSCMAQYRKKKPEGWVRKTEDKNAYARQWRLANPDKVKAYEGKRKYDPAKERLKYERKMRRLKGENYVVGDPSNKSPLSSEEREKRRKARQTYKTALKRGKITPLPCLICGDEAEGHHPDYDRPLDVVWLCEKHHQEVHKIK